MLALFLFAAQLLSNSPQNGARPGIGNGYCSGVSPAGTALCGLAAFDEHLRLGQYYLDRGEPGRAIVEFESAATLKTASAAAHYNLGVSLRLWGDLPGAEKALREAIRSQPQFPEAHFVLGLVLGDRVGSESMGRAEFEIAIAQNPAFPDAHFNLGIIHWKLNEVEPAIAAFTNAVAGRPESAVFRFRLGQALARAGKPADARDQLERAIKLDPSKEATHHQLALTYQKLGDASKAAEAFATVKRLREEAATIGRDQAGLAYRQGRSALERGETDAAIKHLTRALQAPFDEAQTRTMLGIAWQRKGDTSAAAAEFHKAIAINPRAPDPHLNLGVLLMHTGDAAAAEREFRAALDIDPNFAEAHFNLGLTGAIQRRWKEAADSLRTAIRLDPANAHAHWNLGRVLRDSGDRDAARACYATSWKLNPGLPQAALEYGELLPREQAREVWREALKRDALNPRLQEAFLSTLETVEAERSRRRFALLNQGEFRIGVDRLNRGEFPAAIETLSRILVAHPELDEVRRNLALALFANGQHREAAAEYEKLLRVNSGDLAVRLDLGVALREASLLDRARKELEEVVRVKPDFARAHYQLGLLWLAQKDMPRAMEYFHRARRIDPNIKPPGGL